MRTKYIILAICLSLIGLSSCDLNRDPLDRLSRKTVWQSEDNIDVVLTGIYRGNASFSGPEYVPSDWWSYGGLIFLEFASDNMYDRRNTNSNFFKISSGQLVSTNAFISKYWTNSYSKIGRCNELLQNITSLPETKMTKRYIAEARFIRATQYFYLCQYFRDVPLITTVITPEEGNHAEVTKHEELVNFLVKEFSESSADLPRYKELKADEKGRACKQAALAFLGRLFLAEERWEEAAKAFKQIIDFGDNTLYNNYTDLFTEKGESSSEIIFSFQYLPGLAGNAIHQHALPAKDGGWCLANVLGSLFEAYEFTDGSQFSFDSPLYNSSDLGENRDPRLRYTILYNGADFKGEKYISDPDSKSPDKVMGGQTTQTGFLLRKFLDEGYSGSLTLYGGDVPVIRYAEVLLSYLEASLEMNNGVVTQDLLDQTVNLIRKRPSVNMPPITLENTQDLRKRIRNERRVELACEGIRYWDIIRWHIGEEVLSGDIYGSPFPGAKRMNKKDNIKDSYDRWYVNQRSFRSDLDYRWPYPQSEQDINPNLRKQS